MKAKFSILLVFLIGILVVGMASALPRIESLEINNKEIDPFGDETKLVELSDKLDISIELEADDQDYEDLKIRAEIGGYKHGDLTDTTRRFDLDEGDTVTKELEIELPDLMDSDEYYDLRILIYGKEGSLEEYTYNLHLVGDEDGDERILIRDIILSPMNSVKAGRSLLTTVRIENVGEEDSDGIKVTASIPELGVSASDYIDELDAKEKTTSEELYLRIPADAESGSYDLVVTAKYFDGRRETSEKATVQVIGAEVQKELPATSVVSRTNTKTIVKGEGGALYEIAITNGAAETRTFVISADDIEWGTIQVRPENVISIASGATKSVLVYVTADKDAVEGLQDFAVKVESGDDVSELVTLSANITAGEKGGLSSGWKTGLIIALIVLVVILVILGLVIGFSKLKGNEEEGFEESQTYY
ncbi:hypothetical protein DRJ17_02475 [Candidatus Woesearchaeota archaeon]|nr:MAG: hypothetical protein DRJ17_02475 [Candidatus Woesearchaeota archaeon]